MQCAELHGHFSPQELAARIAVLAHKLHNDALVAVERNNHGHAVLARWWRTKGTGICYRDGHLAGWLTIGGDAAGDDREPGCGVGDGAEIIP